MRYLRLITVTAAACALAAGSLQAQFNPTGHGTMNFTNTTTGMGYGYYWNAAPGNVNVLGSYFAEYTAPYRAQFNVQRLTPDLLPDYVGAPGTFGNWYNIFCVGILNTISLGQSVSSYFTNLGSDLNSVGYSTRSHTQAQYLEAAYLASTWGGGNLGQKNVIQGAIWDVMNGPANVSWAWDGTQWIDLAPIVATAVANAPAWATNNAEYWVVVTPDDAVGKLIGGTQEQLVNVTPEPATLLLLGTGLMLSLLGAAVIRRSMV